VTQATALIRKMQVDPQRTTPRPSSRPQSALRTPFEHLRRHGSTRRRRLKLLAQGSLHVEVIGASDLMVVDGDRATSDPFCVVVLQEAPARRTPSPITQSPRPLPRHGDVDATAHDKETFFITGGAVGQAPDSEEEVGEAEGSSGHNGHNDSSAQHGRRRRGSLESRSGASAAHSIWGRGDARKGEHTVQRSRRGSVNGSVVSVMVDGTDIADPAHLLSMYVSMYALPPLCVFVVEGNGRGIDSWVLTMQWLHRDHANPGDETRRTMVRYATLQPQWGEKFEFRCTQLNRQSRLKLLVRHTVCPDCVTHS